MLSQVEREEWRGQVMDRTDVSKEAVDLLGSMLEQDPRKRITADEILRVCSLLCMCDVVQVAA